MSENEREMKSERDAILEVTIEPGGKGVTGYVDGRRVIVIKVDAMGTGYMVTESNPLPLGGRHAADVARVYAEALAQAEELVEIDQDDERLEHLITGVYSVAHIILCEEDYHPELGAILARTLRDLNSVERRMRDDATAALAADYAEEMAALEAAGITQDDINAAAQRCLDAAGYDVRVDSE